MKAGPTQTDIADNVVRGLTSFATEVVHDQVGDVALRAAKRCLVDAVGCALGAQETDVISALRAVASTATSSRPATLWGTTIQTTPDMAAFVNGSATRCLDFNDDYFGTEKTNAHGDTGPHPSDNLGGFSQLLRSPVRADRKPCWVSSSRTRFVGSSSMRSYSAAMAGTILSFTASQPRRPQPGFSDSRGRRRRTRSGSPWSPTSVCTRPGWGQFPTGRVW